MGMLEQYEFYANKIYSMKLHDAYVVDGSLCIIRVPGGWIYLFENRCAFVPFNNEFQSDTSEEK